MPIFHTSRLSEYVSAVYEFDGFDHPELIARFGSLELTYDTIVDGNLCPFSDEYFQQQVALYREIAGRELDQQDGELHEADPEELVRAPNPMGIRKVEDIGEHVRSISTMLSLAALEGTPRVLDLGAGHGLSSEMFAIAGCRVHAIDIDPLLGEISRRRAAERGYDIERTNLNFDDIAALADGAYQAAFFFQSLHHCLRPWRLIEDLVSKLVPDGVIAFSGEPIQDQWWPHWGIRLDPISLFAARRSGWFESGWSHRFIAECFARCGWTLTFFGGGHNHGEIGIATVDPAKRDAIVRKAIELGLSVVEPALNPQPGRYLSHIGVRGDLHGRPAYLQRQPGAGALLYGPYVTLDAGRYEFSMIVAREAAAPRGDWRARIVIEVVAEMGARQVYRQVVSARSAGEASLLIRHFTMPEAARNVEIRVITKGGAQWAVSLPVLRKLA